MKRAGGRADPRRTALRWGAPFSFSRGHPMVVSLGRDLDGAPGFRRIPC